MLDTIVQHTSLGWQMVPNYKKKATYEEDQTPA
jgi:hypothetical protein